jgi:cytoskeletal protein CcmA (bactofilin family)
MFTNKANTPQTSMPQQPEPAPAQRRQAPGRPSIASIIANGVKIIGAIEADGAEIQIDGEIEGNIRGGSMTVGDTGMVKGDIISESVTVHGRVEGSVRARKVMLARNAHVLGDIVHQSLSVEMGAVFEGQCRYMQDPLSQSGGGAGGVSYNSGQQFGGHSGSTFSGDSGDRMVPGVIVTGASN